MLELQEPISGRYRLQQRLHRGGMSDVYRAYDELLQRYVAIKLVSNDQPESRQRLLSEIQTLSRLSHDHILPILDHGEYEAYHYLVMPYMKQGTLRERIAKRSLTEEEAGNILVQVTSALQLMHNHGMIHRDIKPSNILLDDGDERHVYLADFGLAKVIDEGSDLTQTGCLIGTPEYMAPELVDRPESVSSDIYSLGVLLYHMLTGRVPFTGDTPLAVYWKHVQELPVPPSHFNPAITAPVEQVILCALNKEPHQRFPNAIAMVQAYTNALQSSRYAEAALVVQTFEPAPAHRALRKIDSSTLPAAVRQAAPIPWWQNPHHNIQKAIVSLVLVAIFIIPLSLGFLLGRERAHVPPAFSAQLASALHKAPLVSTPQPTQTTPTVHPSSGNTSLPSSPHHKHKHYHKNGNDNANINEA